MKITAYMQSTICKTFKPAWSFVWQKFESLKTFAITFGDSSTAEITHYLSFINASLGLKQYKLI